VTHVSFSYASLRRGSDDIAHAFFPTDALAAVRWSRATGRPAVFSYMGIPQRNVLSSPRMRMRVVEAATRGSSAVTVLSRAAQEGMWRWLGIEARIIYPGVRLDVFSPGDERDDCPTIACAAATDDDRKRIGLLVEAFALVRRQRPDARLLLLRPESDERRQRLLAHTDGIEFFDPDMTGVADVFRRAWVSALTSYNEAFGLVVVESLACGTPVVATRDGGIPEIIDRPEIGRLFDGDDPAAVASQLLDALELSQDPATAGACRKRAEAFSTMTGARAYEALYEELLNG
jgi:glycosyltransferase involved in cell wall biosynthesis